MKEKLLGIPAREEIYLVKEDYMLKHTDPKIIKQIENAKLEREKEELMRLAYEPLNYGNDEIDTDDD